MRGARADDGDEAVDRVLVASLEELKQPGGVGAVVGESVFGCLVATVLVVQRCQVRLFIEGWTLVVVWLSPHGLINAMNALWTGGRTSPHTHFDVEIAQKDSTAYLCSPDEVWFGSSSPAGAARWLVEGSLLGFRDDMLFSLMVGGVAETRLLIMECGLTGSTCQSRLTQDNWMKEPRSMEEGFTVDCRYCKAL